MHMRRRGVKRTGEKFYVDSKEIEVVEEYKYQGCVINGKSENGGRKSKG